MPSPKVTFLTKDSYLAVIKKTLGLKIFRNFYARVNGQKKDILMNGKYACAFYLSAILVWFGLLKEGHCTVAGTLKDMKKSGWYQIKKPKIGCVIHWQLFDTLNDGDAHEHLGFYLGQGLAISNNPKIGHPTQHKYNYRPIENFYWHNKLNK